MNSKADLHLHTNLSDGIATPREIVLAAVKKGINLVAITDHNLIKSALIAKELAIKEKLPLGVIVGEEIITQEGELIALFIKEKIDPWMNVFQAIEAIRKQGGLAIAAHPGRIFNGYSLTFKMVAELAKEKLLDGAEIDNFWDHDPYLAERRQKQNQKWQLAEIGVSDSHQVNDLGTIYTTFPGKDAEDLKKAILGKTTNSVNQSSFWKHRLSELSIFTSIAKGKRNQGNPQKKKLRSKDKFNHLIDLVKDRIT